jgi:hypothetical protein
MRERQKLFVYLERQKFVGPVFVFFPAFSFFPPSNAQNEKEPGSSFFWKQMCSNVLIYLPKRRQLCFCQNHPQHRAAQIFAGKVNARRMHTGLQAQSSSSSRSARSVQIFVSAAALLSPAFDGENGIAAIRGSLAGTE